MLASLTKPLNQRGTRVIHTCTCIPYPGLYPGLYPGSRRPKTSSLSIPAAAYSREIEKEGIGRIHIICLSQEPADSAWSQRQCYRFYPADRRPVPLLL